MAAAFRSSSSTTYASRTNTTLTAPTGITDGDVLLIVHLTGALGGNNAPTATPPTGFATVTGTWPVSLFDGAFNVKVWIWYKVASGESGDYTVTHTSGSSQGYICAISGGTSTKPNATQNNGTGSTTTALTITPSANDSLVMFAGTDWGDNTNALSPPTGTTPTFTERMDPGTVSGIMYVADGVLGTAGATGNKTQTNNSTGSNPWSGYLVVIESSGGGGGSTLVHRNLLLGVGI